MNWYAVFAIYFLMWVICAFIMLPFGLRTPDETGEALYQRADDTAEALKTRLVPAGFLCPGLLSW